MRGLTRRWLQRETGEPLELDVVTDGTAVTLIDRVLHARGLADPDEMRRFCQPKLTDLHPPGQLPNVDAAAERLCTALREGERVAIYGDYDVDGMTATAILYHTIRAVAPDADLVTYVPHRLDEGYGINTAALESLHADGTTLVISVDCGITAVEPAAAARAMGLDLIITDHHHPPDDGAVLPDAIIVHPRLPGSAYPFGELCGAGVAFKLAWRFATTWCGSERVGADMQRRLLDLLPFVALGTIADVVPLVGENRVLTSYGLRLIRQTPFVGLHALLEASRVLDDQVDTEKVGFVLAPRLNACGRMGHAAEAVHLLTDAEPDAARAIARRLTALNDERKQTERAIVEAAAERAVASGMTADDHRVIVLADPEWHPGVIGIVCSRLVERFGRPVVLLQDQDGTCRGSARSIDGYSIHDGLVAVRTHLERFGGHDMAAGLALPSAQLDDFTAALRAHANAHISVEQLTPAIRVDCDASLTELDQSAVSRLGTLSPFGRSNSRPTIRVCNVVIAEAPRIMGSQGRHLAVRVRDGQTRALLRAVWWGSAELAAQLVPGMRVDLAIEPKLNEWNGRTNVEGVIRDVHVRSS